MWMTPAELFGDSHNALRRGRMLPRSHRVTMRLSLPLPRNCSSRRLLPLNPTVPNVMHIVTALPPPQARFSEDGKWYPAVIDRAADVNEGA